MPLTAPSGEPARDSQHHHGGNRRRRTPVPWGDTERGTATHSSEPPDLHCSRAGVARVGDDREQVRRDTRQKADRARPCERGRARAVKPPMATMYRLPADPVGAGYRPRVNGALLLPELRSIFRSPPKVMVVSSTGKRGWRDGGLTRLPGVKPGEDTHAHCCSPVRRPAGRRGTSRRASYPASPQPSLAAPPPPSRCPGKPPSSPPEPESSPPSVGASAPTGRSSL